MSESDHNDQKLPDYSPVRSEKKLDSDDQQNENDEPVHMLPNHIESEDSTSNMSNRPSKRKKPVGTARKHTSNMFQSDFRLLNSTSTTTFTKRQTARKSTSPLNLPNRMRGYASRARYDMPIEHLDPPIEYDRADDFEPTIIDGKLI